jgi:hypothetical protein
VRTELLDRYQPYIWGNKYAHVPYTRDITFVRVRLDDYMRLPTNDYFESGWEEVLTIIDHMPSKVQLMFLPVTRDTTMDSYITDYLFRIS